jgi:tetratricopeptide (TPR) repeat protein
MPTTTRARPVEHLKRAERLLAAGAYDDAAREYARAATRRKLNPDALVGWGNALLELHRPQQARWKFEDAVAVNDRDARAHLGAGKALLALRQLKDAASEFERTVELDSDQAEAWVLWGRTLASDQQHEAALGKYERAISLSPGSSDAYLHAGQVLQKLRDPESAAQRFQAALQIESARPRARVDFMLDARLGYVSALVDGKQWHEAESSGREAVTLVNSLLPMDLLPEIRDYLNLYSAQAQWYIGFAQLELKHYDSAVASFESARDAHIRIGLLASFAAAKTLWRQGLYTQAWEEFGEARTRFAPERHGELAGDPDHRRLYGAVMQGLGDLEAAEEHYRAAIEQSEDNVGALADLMGLHLERGEVDPLNSDRWYWRAREPFSSARRILQHRLQGDPKDPYVLTALGSLLASMEEYGPATEYLTKAVALDPDSPTALANLGLAHARRDRFRLAADRFEAALRRDPDDFMIETHLAETYFRLEALDQAELRYASVLRRASGHVEAHVGLGEVLIARGDNTESEDAYAEAIDHFTEALALSRSMVNPPASRRASSELYPRQAAAVHYARGYAQVRLYEQQSGRARLGATSINALQSARQDFTEALRLSPDHAAARRALGKVEEGLERFSVERLLGQWVPITLIAATLMILVFLQVGFHVGWIRTALGGVQYALLTMGLLAFVLALLSLPQLLKLKLGGIELERAVTDPATSGPISLGITRERVSLTRLRVLEPDYSASRPIPRPRDSPLEVAGKRAAKRTSTTETNTAYGGNGTPV